MGDQFLGLLAFGVLKLLTCRFRLLFAESFERSGFAIRLADARRVRRGPERGHPAIPRGVYSDAV